MSKKNKTRSQIEYDTKRRKEAANRLRVGLSNRSTKPNDSLISLEPIRDNNHVNGVSEDLSPRDLSHHTFNWDGQEESSMFVPDLVNGNGIDSLKDNRLKEKLLLRGDAALNEKVIEFVNYVAKGEDVPKAVEQTLFDKDRSSRIIAAATVEGIHRWHDLRPRNGSLGKERG